MVRSRRHRWASSRGATLVEFALVLSLVAVASLGAFQALGDATENEVDNEADCISTRPPPSSCLRSAIPPTTTTTIGPGPTTPPTSPPGPPETVTIDPNPTITTTPAGSRWDVEAVLQLTDDSTPPDSLEDEVVTVQVTFTGSTVPARVGQFIFVECVINGAGQCTLRFDSQYADVTQLSIDVVAVGIDTPYDFPDFTPVVIDRP